MLEKEVERHLREGVKILGGMCLKFVTPGFTGVPDRIVIMPGGHIAFVELKRPGQRERQRQGFVQRQLRRLGCRVFSSVDSWVKVDDVLCWCMACVAGLDGETGERGTSSVSPSGCHLPQRGKAFGGKRDG